MCGLQERYRAVEGLKKSRTVRYHSGAFESRRALSTAQVHCSCQLFPFYITTSDRLPKASRFFIYFRGVTRTTSSIRTIQLDPKANIDAKIIKIYTNQIIGIENNLTLRKDSNLYLYRTHQKKPCG